MYYYQYWTVLRAGSLLLIPFLLNAAARTEPTPRVLGSYGKLPLSFERNNGQTDSRAKFLARGAGYTLFLTSDSAVLSLRGKTKSAALRMKLVGANRNPEIAGTDALPGKSNYFVGNDPSRWRTNVPNYAKVKYRGVYPGIDLVYYGNQRLLEYDFLVAPGADPRTIELRFEGAKQLTVNSEGALVLDMGGGEVIEHAPAVYQEIAGERLTVTGKYVLRGRGRVGFSIAGYDKAQPLVIDPTLVYSTYLGGRQGDNGFSIAVDAFGYAYIGGATASPDFPTTSGAFQTTMIQNSVVEGFITKLNPTGSSLVYSTFLGGGTGSGGWINSIAVDAAGSAYVTGQTTSRDFPTTTGAFQTTYGNGDFMAFVSKLNSTGSALAYSTFLGDNQSPWGAEAFGIAIAVDAPGNAYVTGFTNSAKFPVTPGAFVTPGSGAFVTKLNPSGTALVFSSILGSGEVDGVAVDGLGNVYVTGSAGGSDFPTTPGAFLTTAPGGGFVTKLNPSGSALVYSTFLGTGWGAGNKIAIDLTGNAYVTGSAESGFPTTPGAFQRTFSGGDYDVFVSKLNAAGSALLYSTYLGGSGDEQGRGIAIDATGNAYVSGYTQSADFPTTPNAFQTAPPGPFSGGKVALFVSKLNATGSALLYSTYLGGTGGEYDSTGSALDASGDVYVTGTTFASDFPTAAGAFQPVSAGDGQDAFVTKLNLVDYGAPPVTTATLTGPGGNNGWYLGNVTVTLTATGTSNPVAKTFYAIGNSACQTYAGPFAISGDGTHQVLFYSVDTAGNQEAVHAQTIKIDTTKPASHVAALPASEPTPTFQVSWTGADAASGVLDYSVYVSDNGGLFTAWLTNTTSTLANFTGSYQHTYGFFSTSRDVAGNVEAMKATAEAATKVPALVGDVNGDGKVDCTDIAIVKASFGKKAGQTGFDPRADVNKDGIVDVRDLAIVAQKLPAGTKCP